MAGLQKKSQKHGSEDPPLRPEAKRDFIPQNARDGAEVSLRRQTKDEERFLSAQADRFAGAKREEKVGLLRSK